MSEMEKRRRVFLTVGMKKELCQYKVNHPSATLTEVSKMFKKKWNTTIGMTTIRDILHEKNKWLSVSEHFEGNKRISAGKYHELEDALYRVFTEALDSNEVVTDEWLLKKARVIGKQMNVMEFRYSNGWLRGFKKRYLIAKCAASRANVSMYRKNTNSSSSMWPLASKKEAMMIQEQVNHDYTATDDGHSAPSNATITLQEAKAALIKVIDFVSCFTMRDQFLCPLISLLKYLEACNLPASDEGLVNIEIKQENDSPGDLELSAIPEDSNFLDIKVEKMFHDGSDQFDNSMNRVENDASWNESYGLEADEGMQVPSASEKLIGVNEQTTKHIQDKEKYNIRKDMFIKFIEYVDEKACYKCTVCGKSYSTFDRCKRHIRVVHSGERPFKCLSCGKAFPEKCSLKVHSRVHSGEKPYLCTKCGKRLCTLSGLIVHMRCHSGEKPYTCQLCNKSFRYPSSLSDHRRVHSNEKPYKCSTCSKAFKSSSDLNVHRRCHTGERPYKCTICGMAFMRVNVHKAHMRRHTGEKPFACHLCYKAFAQKALLTKHIRVHTGERPFSCPVCGRCFSQNGSLYHHQKMHQK